MIGILLGIVAAIALVGYTYHLGVENGVSNYKDKLEAAERKLETAVKKQEQEAANHIIDMGAAFQAGEENAKVVERKVFVRVAGDLTKYPVFQNPACVLPEQSYALLAAALRGTRTGVTLPAELVERPAAAAPPPPAAAPAAPSGTAPPKPVPKKKAGT